jgi:hypothetical protein
MFGSKDSGQLRWCLAALVFVWAAAIAGIASAGTKVTICHIPPGNPANFQQITIDSAAVPAHLAHGDFVPPTGSCAADCNVNTTLCNTPPDQCHQAGTCVASTGLCDFPLQPDLTACTGTDGLSCDSCQNGACISVSSCAGINSNNFQDPYAYCSPAMGGTCTGEAINCPPPPSSAEGCYRTGFDPVKAQCVEDCQFGTTCNDGGVAPCSNVVACTTDADCSAPTLGNTGLPDKCQIGSCDTQRGLCIWNGPFGICPSGEVCDRAFGCYAPTPPTP